MTMTPDYRATARRWFDDNWNRRREAVIDELLTPATVGHMEGGDVHGAEEFKAARTALLGAFPDMRLVVEDIVVEGSQAVVRWSVSGTHLGDHLGFAASRRPANFRGMTWLKFEGDKIAEGWDGWNQGALLASLQAATP
jgi:predicted ester cyclase